MSKRTVKLLIWTFGWSLGWFGAFFLFGVLIGLLLSKAYPTQTGIGFTALRFAYSRWLLTPILGFVTAMIWLWFRDPDFAEHPPGHCQSCGYNLTGNQSGICSECGAVITSNDSIRILPPGP